MAHLIERFRRSLEISLGKKPSVLAYIHHFFGVIIDYIIFGATLTDHFELSMIKHSFSEKKEYMTWRLSKKFIFTVDSAETISKYRKNKNVMYDRLRAYLGRDVLYPENCSKEELEQFLAKHKRFLYKPNNQSCGVGIRVVDTETTSDDEIASLIKDGGLFDELITQHHEMASLTPASVNTLRVFTLKDKGQIHFIGAALRIGNGKDVIDNYSAGGQVCAINLDNGRVIDLAEDMYGRRTSNSPSGVVFTSFAVPMWKELKEFIVSMAKDFELNYVAWDVAICEDGFKLVEANPRGMVNVIQIAGNGGKRKRYEELLKMTKRS